MAGKTGGIGFGKTSLFKGTNVPYRYRKPKTDNLRIFVNPELKTISRQEISAVRQQMNALNCKSLEINDLVKKGGLHSILFDNRNKKDRNQILGVILDKYNHFVGKKSRNRRYITFSSALNNLNSKVYTQNESLDTAIYNGSFGSFSGFRLSRKFNFCLMMLLAVAMCFFVSCGSSSSSGGESVSNFGKLGQECYPNKSCDGSLLCDEATNRCIEDPENPIHDSGNPSNSDDENNDKDEQPINNNDSDDVIENNDKDEHPIETNDNDTIENNDGDPIENNDGDNNEPTENDNSDNTPGYYYVTNNFTPEDMVATKEEINNSPDEVNKKLKSKHSYTRDKCPSPDWQSNEEYDETGNLYVVDKCKIIMDNELRWLEQIVPIWFYNAYNYITTSPTRYRIVYMQVDYANKGSPSNVKIRQPFIIYDIDLTSANCLGQATEDTSVITANTDSACVLDNIGGIGNPIQTKNEKQTRDSSAQDIALCATMPNHQYDEETNTCYTTVEEFGWVENIPHKLLNKKGFSWATNGYRVNRIERHLDTNTFYMDIQMKNMNIHVELPNAKSCMLQCQGQEGCTVHIEPSPDASKGCFVNGAEVEE